MNADQRLLAMAFVISATAYLLGCLACAIAWQVHTAAFVAVIALALSAGSYFCQFNGWRILAIPFSVGSWFWGVWALVALLPAVLG